MNSIEKIIQFLQARILNIQGIYLFGSRADLTARTGSDYDIAFLLATPAESPDPYTRFIIQQDLADELGADVDLVDLRVVKTDFQFRIISTAHRIFCADKTLCDQFEMTTYSMYQYLEEERKNIVEDIKKRGSVYG